MKRKIFPVLISVLLISSCSQQQTFRPVIPVQTNTIKSELTRFYPVNAGTSWVYELEQFQGDKPNNKFKEMTITVLENKGNAAVLKRSYPDSPVQPHPTLVEIFSDRVELSRYVPSVSEIINLNREEDKQSITILKAPLTSGTNWEGRVFQGGTETIKVLGYEVVTVPAGTFKTLKVNHNLQYDNGREDNLYYWYAENTGTVKMYEEISVHLDKWVKFSSTGVLKAFSN